ncbi:ABL062Cp [Eremothecium gossypii ATCC 10895]|uniref:ABL062Cp n=1 Tax=Eremothecium gossypii (strain ATCC 10895 / CBS 109.51 / FGSC 9923 / NRRL Y-1056) TaxID=284811 RepID=Q75DT5_EREGS|nr:ABL062Cp [Eremothecium gossypii ATCC 10895]AAS50709.1 ABL062Cp [Eremothecium gossypii ATCC 10895]AEY94997.1 FABL062Cp [Eremothecium gossypii FDAG1]
MLITKSLFWLPGGPAAAEPPPDSLYFLSKSILYWPAWCINRRGGAARQPVPDPANRFVLPLRLAVPTPAPSYLCKSPACNSTIARSDVCLHLASLPFSARCACISPRREWLAPRGLRPAFPPKAERKNFVSSREYRAASHGHICWLARFFYLKKAVKATG